MQVLKINGIEVKVADGTLLVDAAWRAGVDVPTLCYAREVGAITSCMICVVKDLGTGRMLPACSAKALDGMDIDASGPEVRNARREILNMLLSEHVGDCEAPCSRICPASLNIPRMLRYIAKDNMEAAAWRARDDLIFPATLGHLCTAPCENGCRRASFDNAISIRELHRTAAEMFLHNGCLPIVRAPSTGKTVAVIGAGLAGLSAAWMCLNDGHACRVFEKRSVACARLRALPADQLPMSVLDAEIDGVREMGAELSFDCEVGVHTCIESIAVDFDAVIVACDIPFPKNEKFFSALEDSMLVRSVGNGKAAARKADTFMFGFARGAPPMRFDSRIGRLTNAELDSYAEERLNASESGAPRLEAARCLHCDCFKTVSCKLRRYANEYEAGTRLKRHMPRPPVEAIKRSGDVLFEPGKCIRCGICVELARASGTASGLAFAGRGLASRVQVPFDGPLEIGLGEAALQCVRACPTGALAMRNEEERI